MKYHVISDIHGYYDVMIHSLNKAGYDPTNEEHHLIVLGDMFDRGPHSDKVFEYIYDLHQKQKATVILGNHDSFLLDLLDGDDKNAHFNIQYNGFGKTLLAFSGTNTSLIAVDHAVDRINQRYPHLHQWLAELPYYIELGDYIFVHGGIDGSMLDWKSMSSRRDFIWNREILLPRVEGKIVVAGHHRVATIRKKTNDYHLLFLHQPELFDILHEEGKILIDRFVEASQELNVLILDIKA